MDYLLSLEQAGHIMGYGKDTMYKLARTDPTFPAVKIRGVWRVSEARLKKYLAEYYERRNPNYGSESFV